MPSDSNSKKKLYSRPIATKLTPEEARQIVAERTNCSDQEAADFLESLRKQQQNEANEEHQQDGTDAKRKRSA